MLLNVYFGKIDLLDLLVMSFSKVKFPQMFD